LAGKAGARTRHRIARGRRAGRPALLGLVSFETSGDPARIVLRYVGRPAVKARPADAVDARARPWDLGYERRGDALVVRMRGSWRMRDRLPDAGDVRRAIEPDPRPRRLEFDSGGVEAWDTGLLTFASRALDIGREAGLDVDPGGLPEGARRLLSLAATTPDRNDHHAAGPPSPWLARIGHIAIRTGGGAVAMIAFIGEAVIALYRFVLGRARFQGGDLALIIQECGPRALPIVTLISFLVGLILAFVGAVQLRQFGAQIYVADLVGIAMAQEMGAMMTAIIMAGRTGAAFAAQLGTMQVNEEIDALRTMGISPMEFLVLPRMIALILMVPLLTLYADLLGILGGAAVGVTMLNQPAGQYLNETVAALTIADFVKGLVKATVFGVLVAIAGCLRGIQSGRSSQAVGLAATSAVVTGIVFIIVADAILTVIYHVLGV
jgi:phospholipid/cholesterol/gamma-HCH transport system permease protein